MTLVSFLLYLGLAAAGAFFFLFVLGHKYFLNLGGMRKDAVYTGTAAMSISLALFLLFVFLFPAPGGTALLPKLLAARERSIEYWKEQRTSPFPAPGRKNVADLSYLPVVPAALPAPVLVVTAAVLEGSILVLLFVLVILSREPRPGQAAEDRRKHIFEYTRILDTLNKTK